MSASPSVDVLNDETVLVIERIFDAPRALVFKAWADPKHLYKWLGPVDYPAVTAAQDVRQGGAWNAMLRSPLGKPDLRQSGFYKDVVQNEKLVFTFAWDAPHGGAGHEMLVSITFSDHGRDQTKMVFQQTLLPSLAQREGHRYGWNSTFDRLGDYLRTLSSAQDNARFKAQFVFPEDEPVIVMSRMFDAPREMVWAAYTKPEHMARWWGPHKYDVTVKEMDLRVGGKWRMINSTKDEAHEFFGEYLEIVAPGKLVWTFGYGDYTPAIETMVFEDVNGKTRITGVSCFATIEDRNGMAASGMEAGANETFERLDALLKTL